MKKKSFQVALSAISCALAVIFMAAGLNIPMAFASGYVLASLALMLPLAKEMRLGGFLAYAGACLLCLPFGGIAQFYKLFPFVVFFGLHPLVNSFQQRLKINRFVAFAVKDVWFVGSMMLSWLLFDAAVEISLPFAWMYDWIWLLIAAGGTVLFFCLRLADPPRAEDRQYVRGAHRPIWEKPTAQSAPAGVRRGVRRSGAKREKRGYEKRTGQQRRALMGVSSGENRCLKLQKLQQKTRNLQAW